MVKQMYFNRKLSITARLPEAAGSGGNSVFVAVPFCRINCGMISTNKGNKTLDQFPERAKGCVLIALNYNRSSLHVPLKVTFATKLLLGSAYLFRESPSQNFKILKRSVAHYTSACEC